MQTRAESQRSPGLLTLQQVAEYLGVCRAHVYKLIDLGLPVIRLGRSVRVHKDSLDCWLKDQEQTTQPF
jgi:excisionase family DNA binding protein